MTVAEEKLHKGGGRVKRKLLFAAVAALIVIAQQAAFSPGSSAVTRYFGFDGCSWHAYADDGFDNSSAFTRTWDDNGGCSYLDADTKYFKDGQIRTKWCSSQNAQWRSCNVTGSLAHPRDHHQSRNKAKSWETSRWQSSGWWG